VCVCVCVCVCCVLAHVYECVCVCVHACVYVRARRSHPLVPLPPRCPVNAQAQLRLAPHHSRVISPSPSSSNAQHNGSDYKTLSKNTIPEKATASKANTPTPKHSSSLRRTAKKTILHTVTRALVLSATLCCAVLPHLCSTPVFHTYARAHAVCSAVVSSLQVVRWHGRCLGARKHNKLEQSIQWHRACVVVWVA
jgi:hypothetical protein